MQRRKMTRCRHRVAKDAVRRAARFVEALSVLIFLSQGPSWGQSARYSSTSEDLPQETVEEIQKKTDDVKQSDTKPPERENLLLRDLDSIDAEIARATIQKNRS